MKTFKQIEDFLKKGKKNTLVLAAADEEESLLAVKQALEKGVVKLILVGNSEFAKRYFKDKVEIVHEPDPGKAVKIAVDLLCKNKADAIMKGLVHTDVFLKEILKNKEILMKGKFLSHVAVFQYKNRFIIASDAGMNIDPDVEQKVEIIKNAYGVSQKIGMDNPKIAIVCPTEKVNMKIESTVEAAIISKMAERGQLGIKASVDGPMALDVALSKQSVKIKKVISYNGVAGEADILILDSLNDGNLMYKSMELFLDPPRGAVVAGISKSIILTSRSDDHITKYNSILLALVISK